MTIILYNNNSEATIRSLKLLRFELSMIMVIRSTLLRSIMMKKDSHLQDLSKAMKSLIEFWERATCILLSRLKVHKLIKVVQRVRNNMTSKALWPQSMLFKRPWLIHTLWMRQTKFEICQEWKRVRLGKVQKEDHRLFKNWKKSLDSEVRLQQDLGSIKKSTKTVCNRKSNSKINSTLKTRRFIQISLQELPLLMRSLCSKAIRNISRP